MTAAEQRLETLLRSAASEAAWPPTPDLRATVVARIQRGAVPANGAAPAAGAVPPSRGRSEVPVRAVVPGRARPRPRVRLVRALAVALLALLVLAGVATALGFRLPGLTIERVEELPPAGTGLDLGSPVPLAEARNDEPPRILVPAALPEPGQAFVQGTGDRRLVTLAWRADAGDPTIPGTDLSIAITAVPGRTDEGFLSKMLGPGTTIEPVSVGGDRGWWIAGAPHELLVVRPDGSSDMMASRLAGDTLVFAHDGTLYRLESALGRDATVAVAESLR